MLKKLYIEPICDLNLEAYRHVLETMPKSLETIFFGSMDEPLFHKDILTMIHGILDAGLSRLWISMEDLETDFSINAAADRRNI